MLRGSSSSGSGKTSQFAVLIEVDSSALAFYPLGLRESRAFSGVKSCSCLCLFRMQQATLVSESRRIQNRKAVTRTTYRPPVLQVAATGSRLKRRRNPSTLTCAAALQRLSCLAPSLHCQRHDGPQPVLGRSPLKRPPTLKRRVRSPII